MLSQIQACNNGAALSFPVRRIRNTEYTTVVSCAKLSFKKANSTGSCVAFFNRSRRINQAGKKNTTVSEVYNSVLEGEHELDWDKLGFGLTETPFMFVAKKPRESGEWTGGVVPFGNLSLSPSAAILNYGQGVFEGMKAYHTAKERVVVFRPDQNAERMQIGARRMCMDQVPADFFKQAILDTVAANIKYIPPMEKGALYIRPLLIGSGAILGLGPAPEYTFVVYVSPVASYFKGGQLSPIDLLVSESFHRAAPGGAGGTKCVGNYAQVLVTQLEAKKQGFSDVVYLDAKEDKYIEEVSSCNMFVVKDNVIRTPPAGETILSGITRRSVIELARHKGYEVREERVTLEDAMKADEVFCTGTAVVIVPVGSITYKGQTTKYEGHIGQDMYDSITNIQYERAEDEFGWVVEVPIAH